jgi:hypothetical protein
MIQYGTNDVKYHLFTLMVFDLHHIGVPFVWVIASWQTYEDFVEWFIPLQVKLVANVPH